MIMDSLTLVDVTRAFYGKVGLYIMASEILHVWFEEKYSGMIMNYGVFNF